MTRKRIFQGLAVSLIIQSLSSVFIKLAGNAKMNQIDFWFCYAAALACLAVFSIMWQVLLKYVPLSTAYLRKGISYILVLFWSAILFHERVTVANLIGSILIIMGIGVNANEN